MKKILSFFAIVALFSACEQDIQTNTPGFQAKLNDVQWRANNASVAIRLQLLLKQLVVQGRVCDLP